jgi:predicted outer membrane protein
MSPTFRTRAIATGALLWISAISGSAAARSPGAALPEGPSDTVLIDTLARLDDFSREELALGVVASRRAVVEEAELAALSSTDPAVRRFAREVIARERALEPLLAPALEASGVASAAPPFDDSVLAREILAASRQSRSSFFDREGAFVDAAFAKSIAQRHHQLLEIAGALERRADDAATKRSLDRARRLVWRALDRVPIPGSLRAPERSRAPS